MKEAHDRAVQILSSKRDQMDLMATVLLERETIDGDACQALLNNRWAEYLQEEQAKEAEGKKPELETAEDAPGRCGCATGSAGLRSKRGNIRKA